MNDFNKVDKSNEINVHHGSVGSLLLGARHGQEGVADVNCVAGGEMKSFDKCEISLQYGWNWAEAGFGSWA